MFAWKGTGGELRAGPYTAAQFAAWSLVRADDMLNSDAATVQVEALHIVDTFWLEACQLDLWLNCGRAWWIWRDVTIDGATIRMRGRPEIRPKHE